jgi:hypothetical protein
MYLIVLNLEVPRKIKSWIAHEAAETSCISRA